MPIFFDIMPVDETRTGQEESTLTAERERPPLGVSEEKKLAADVRQRREKVAKLKDALEANLKLGAHENETTPVLEIDSYDILISLVESLEDKDIDDIAYLEEVDKIIEAIDKLINGKLFLQFMRGADVGGPPESSYSQDRLKAIIKSLEGFDAQNAVFRFIGRKERQGLMNEKEQAEKEAQQAEANEARAKADAETAIM